MSNITTIMDIDLTVLDDIVKFNDLIVYTSIGCVWMLMTGLLFYIVVDDTASSKDHLLHAKVIELSKQIESMKEGVDEEDIAVFRFMDGNSFYILDDDDEYVMVSPWHKPARIVRIEKIEVRPITRLSPAGGLIIYAEDVCGDTIRLSLANFFDEFERDMFKEFVEDYF